MKKPAPEAKSDAPRLIAKYIDGLGDWRGAALTRLRRIILSSGSGITEAWKWGVPVWEADGIVCVAGAFKAHVKLTFPKGASLRDPKRLFNAGLEGKAWRAIDFHQGDKIDAAGIKALVRGAAALNAGTSPKRPGAAARAKAHAVAKGKPVKLLAGGNPQIAKAEGDAPVQAYISSIPDWKRDIGRRLDALITRAVPGVRKAVKWNSPFYGVSGRGWFLSFHVFTRYVKVTFFLGASLRPVPPGGTGKDARWIDIHEDDLDETRMAAWVRQAAALPGWAV